MVFVRMLPWRLVVLFERACGAFLVIVGVFLTTWLLVLISGEIEFSMMGFLIGAVGVLFLLPGFWVCHWGWRIARGQPFAVHNSFFWMLAFMIIAMYGAGMFFDQSRGGIERVSEFLFLAAALASISCSVIRGLEIRAKNIRRAEIEEWNDWWASRLLMMIMMIKDHF